MGASHPIGGEVHVDLATYTFDTTTRTHNEWQGKVMETMSLVAALTASAYHAAEAQDFGHTINACRNGRTGRYELSSTSGWARITHDFATLGALVDYVETANRLETVTSSASGWAPFLAQRAPTR
jgi:hypothetical protein